MRPTRSVRGALVVAIVVALIGGLDAGRGGEWDLVVVLTVLALVLVVLLARTTVARPLVPIRADLVRWLDRRAGITGDAPERLADRALAAYRDGLMGREEQPDADRRT